MLLPISNTPRDYAWGSLTDIAALQGREPSGRPEAEVWLGDHPGAPAIIGDGSDRSLITWIADNGAAHGVEEPLSFLVKILAAGSPLSIQAHPTIDQARAGFARDESAGIPVDAPERNYRDANHKPEVIIALSDPFLALAGFRAVDETRALLAELGGAGAAAIGGRLDEASGDLSRVVAWLLSARDGGADAAAAVADFEERVRAAASEVGGTDASARAFADEVSALAMISGHYPGDPGIAVAALLNLVRLAPAEAIFVPAGAPHAYLQGLGVEVMAASDNVLRGGLTPKHIDVEELVSVLDGRAGAPPRLAPRGVAPGVWRLDPPVDDFRIVRIARALDDPAEVSGGTPAVVVATGAASVAQGSETLALAAGEAVFATPDDGPLRVAGAAVVAFGRERR